MSGELPRVEVNRGEPERDAQILDRNGVDHADLADLVARTDQDGASQAASSADNDNDNGVDFGVIGGTGFDVFYRATHTDVARALAMTLRDVDLAADSIDEAFARAYQRWDQVSDYDNPGGWVYRVALNHATSRLRQIRRRSALAGEQRLSVEHVEHLYADPEVGAALATLSVGHRSVVVCRLLLGWSEKDTALALGIRPGTAKSRLSRALKHLHSRLTHLRPEES